MGNYRFVFRNDPIAPLEQKDDKTLTVYHDHVLIREPVSNIPEPDTMVVIEIIDGIDRPLLKVTTNKTVDMMIDSKDGQVEEIVKGLWKIRCSERTT